MEPDVMVAGAPAGASSLVSSPAEARVRRVVDYIRANLDRALRLAELSALACLSPFHFARLFNRATGLPPHRFVIRQRIDEAARLLAADDVPIAAIAAAVGFRTPSHFTTVFRRMRGLTPGAYRSACRARTPGAR